jgi:hypothetical protein
MYRKAYNDHLPPFQTIYMCMTCNSAGKITKKKIVVLSSAASGIAATTYVAFTVTHNPAIAATMLALLSLAACPAMCVGMGGAYWLVRRLSGKKRTKDQILKSKEEEKEGTLSCSCSNRRVAQPNEKQQEMMRYSKPESKNENDIDIPSYYVQAQKKEFEN